MSFSYALRIIEEKINELEVEKARIMSICDEFVVGAETDPIYRIFKLQKDLKESKDVLENYIFNKEL